MRAREKKNLIRHLHSSEENKMFDLSLTEWDESSYTYEDNVFLSKSFNMALPGYLHCRYRTYTFNKPCYFNLLHTSATRYFYYK